MSQKKSFAKNVVFEQSKKFYLFFISMLYTYLIANALGPANYGLVIYYISFTASIINFLGVFFIQGLTSVFIPKFKSKKLFFSVLKWQYYIILPVVLIFFISSDLIVSMLGKASPWLFKGALLLLLLMPLYMSLLYLMRSFKRFGKTLKAESLMQTLNLSSAFILIYFLKLNAMAVIIAQAIAVIFSILLLLLFFKKIKFNDESLHLNEIKNYSKSAFPSSIIKNGFNSFKLYLMGLYVNNLLLGYYYLVQKVTGFFIGSAFATLQDVLTPYSMEKHDNKKVLGNFVSLTLKFSIILSILIGVFTIFVAMPLIEIFFPKFSNAVIFLPLSVSVAIFNQFSIISTVFKSINKMVYILKSVIISILINIPLAVYLISNYSVYGIFYSSILYSIVFGAFIYYYSSKIGVKIEVIPTLSDLKYFTTQALKVLTKK